MNWLKHLFSGSVAPGVPTYHEGPIYDTSGASREVYNKPFAYPLLSFRGNGRLAGNLDVVDNAQVHNQVVVTASIGQPGAIAGPWEAKQQATEVTPITVM